MFEVRSEAHGRVLSAIEDIKSCCEIRDFYEEWSDIAASSIQAFLEDLTAEQLDDTCGAFREFITETADDNPNLANGIKDGLRICLNEMLNYIGDVSEDDDRETAYIAEILKSEIKRLEK